jgi:hypothetical protein
MLTCTIKQTSTSQLNLDGYSPHLNHTHPSHCDVMKSFITPTLMYRFCLCLSFYRLIINKVLSSTLTFSIHNKQLEDTVYASTSLNFES